MKKNRLGSAEVGSCICYGLMALSAGGVAGGAADGTAGAAGVGDADGVLCGAGAVPTGTDAAGGAAAAGRTAGGLVRGAGRGGGLRLAVADAEGQPCHLRTSERENAEYDHDRNKGPDLRLSGGGGQAERAGAAGREPRHRDRAASWWCWGITAPESPLWLSTLNAVLLPSGGGRCM